ncbi:sugar diacid recognition [Bifidobacterium vansinderenii]|uniref:Sugar diacid recognition n=2 Tax=Bifidobacterium vansinderenii TaxID=1984871 RepID=A0A229VX03_9BIFI|nr:sugar diacid recognition [Bifidobacterium vansinderenii]
MVRVLFSCRKILYTDGMNIDPRIAQTIVENLKGIIRHDINFFSPDGTMIASTDPTRIGTLHDAALLAAQQRRTIAVDNDEQFAGARHGINAPVLLNDDVVAVIGVTGERAQVEPFSDVIRKMTEILVRENTEQISRFDERMMTTNLISLLTAEQHDHGLVTYLADALNVDLNMPRLVAVGRCTAQDADHSGRDTIYDVLHRHLGQRSGTLFTVSAQGFCVLMPDGDTAINEAAATGASTETRTLMDAMRVDMERTLNRPISLGLGCVADTADQYWVSHRQAGTAVDWLRFIGSASTIEYDELDYGLLLSAIPQTDAARFVEHVFAGIPDADIDDLQRTFDVYTKHNGSISRAADELFLHKNTLQNHLNAMARRTGYNPRTLDDHTVLALAFLLRRYLAFHRA